MRIRVVSFLLLLGAALALPACNTVEGFAKDVQHGAAALERAAVNARD